MDTPENSTEQSDDGSDNETAKAIDWAKKHKYSPDVNLKSRGRRRNLFVELGDRFPQVPTRPVQPSPITTPTRPLEVDLTGMTIKKAFKGAEDKKVCLIEVSGKSFVLKGAEGTPASHVAATDCIRKLQLKGVKAPVTRVLSGQEKSDLVGMLANGDLDAQQMSKALAQGTGQLSELSVGTNSNKIFLEDYIAAGINAADELREQILDLDKDVAWKSILEEWNQKIYESQGAATKQKGEEHRQKLTLFGKYPDLKSTDANARSKALEELRKAYSSPKDVAKIDVLSEIERGEVKEAFARAKLEREDREEKAKQLKAFAESPAGIEAYAGVAVSDLVTGMYDRILGAWNGGNFLFDPDKGELCCIDNAKETNDALDAPTQDSWQQWYAGKAASGPLEDMIFDKIWGTKNPGTPDMPSNYTEFDEQGKAAAKDTIRKVLKEVVTKIENDPDFGPAAAHRVAFLKAKMILDDIFTFPAHLAVPPDLPPKLTKTEKAERALLGRFTPNSEDKRNTTQKIKDDLRKGKLTPQEAKQKLNQLGDNTDRRITKIQFLVAATEFRDVLDSISKDLNAYLKSNPPPEVWSADTAKVMSAPLRTAFEAWWESSKKDEKIRKMISKAWAGFPNEVKSA